MQRPSTSATRPAVTVSRHPDGFAHTRSTIATMARLAREGSHSYDVRAAATRIVHNVPGKQTRQELLAIYQWVRDNIRYRYDPIGLEWVQSPARTMLERAGDCDDMATLIAALAGSLGHQWRFATVGPSARAMKHVHAEVWDGHGWVSLDPVLEPAAVTTTSSAGSVGMFGRAPPARARHTWSSGGDMLSGGVAPNSRGVAVAEGMLGGARLVHVESHTRRRPRRHRSGLSGPVSVGQRELWSWAAYYPSNPQVMAGAGIAPVPSVSYRSYDAPGYGPPTIVSAPAGALSGGLAYIDGIDGGLGAWGFLKKIGKAVGGAVKGAASLVGKIPGVNLIASVIPGASLALSAAKMVGGALSPGGKSGGGGPAPAGAPAAITPGPGSNPYAPPPSASGSRSGPGASTIALAQRSDIDSLRNEIRSNAGLATRADLASINLAIQNRNSAACAAAAKVAAKAHAAALKAATKKAAANEKAKAKKAILALAKANRKVVAKLERKLAKQRSKYPAGSRQTFDVAANKYRIFSPAAPTGVAGLGAFRPTLTFALSGGLGSFGLATAAQAASAVASVAAFQKANKAKPPQVRLAAVATFQQADGTLTPDGLWGPNARAAAAWYLSKPIASLPAVAAPYAKGKITWRAPPVAPPRAAVAAAVKAAQPLKRKPAVASGRPVASRPKAPKAPKRRRPPTTPYGPAPVSAGGGGAGGGGAGGGRGAGGGGGGYPAPLIESGTSQIDPGLPERLPIAPLPPVSKAQRKRAKRAWAKRDRAAARGGAAASGASAGASAAVNPCVWLALGWLLLSSTRRRAA